MMNVHWLEQSEADVPSQNDWLGANEAIRLSSMRFAKRRADWLLGRWTAKRALSAYLKLPFQPDVFWNLEVCAAESGAPEVFFGTESFPLTISLSHRAGRAVCAIAPSDAALGCDLEVAEAHSDGFIADYFSAEEQAVIAQSPATERPALVSLFWSAKESALKALHAGLRMDTRSVTVRLLNTAPCSGEQDGRSSEDPSCFFRRYLGRRGWQALHVSGSDGRVFHGWWQRSGDLLRTVVAAPPPAPPILLKLLSGEWPGYGKANNQATTSAARDLVGT
jgi:4'-phosphopantetheinyl transferase